MDELYFEWDDTKENINIQKHGINFTIAAKVFLDPNRLERYDEKHSRYEDRYNTIGLVDDILFVVYTERTNNIRIISARIATKEEKEAYRKWVLLN